MTEETEVKTRIRRGKVVVIPPEWVGKFPTDKTKRDRKSSRQSKKLRHRRNRKKK